MEQGSVTGHRVAESIPRDNVLLFIGPEDNFSAVPQGEISSSQEITSPKVVLSAKMPLSPLPDLFRHDAGLNVEGISPSTDMHSNTTERHTMAGPSKPRSPTIDSCATAPAIMSVALGTRSNSARMKTYSIAQYEKVKGTSAVNETCIATEESESGGKTYATKKLAARRKSSEGGIVKCKDAKKETVVSRAKKAKVCSGRNNNAGSSSSSQLTGKEETSARGVKRKTRNDTEDMDDLRANEPRLDRVRVILLVVTREKVQPTKMYKVE